MTDQEVVEIYQSAGGILKGHFQLASGRHSDTYMQSAKLFMYPDKSKVVCKALAEKIEGKFDTVVSPAVGGLLLGYEMSAQLNIPNIFYERVEGKMTLRRGFEIVPGHRYLVVEDVVTTGGSVKEVVAEIEAAGGIVPAVASVVDRSNGKVEFGRAFYSLLRQEIVSYEASDCPLCKQGIPVVKPGTKALGANKAK